MVCIYIPVALFCSCIFRSIATRRPHPNHNVICPSGRYLCFYNNCTITRLFWVRIIDIGQTNRTICFGDIVQYSTCFICPYRHSTSTRKWVCITTDARGGSRGRYYGVSQHAGSVVRRIIIPCTLIVGYFPYHQSMSWQICIPTT